MVKPTDNNSVKKILIIEDEKPLANALNLKLSEEGYQITIAEDGEEGLQKVKNGEFDLILLDIIMPKLNGFSLLELLQKAGDKSQTIVVLSNLGQEDDVVKAKELGAQDYMVKANSPIAKIVDKVHSILG